MILTRDFVTRDFPMIFTRDFVTRKNHWQITPLVTKKRYSR